MADTREITVTINGAAHTREVETRLNLADFLRHELEMTGTHVGCDTSQCGACTVHVNGAATRSCSIPMAALDGADVKTIEALSEEGVLHPVQQAWIEEDVAQCGYCQAGQIMAVVELLSRIPEPTDADIDEQLTNICRCGTYYRLRKAVHRAAALLKAGRAQ